MANSEKDLCVENITACTENKYGDADVVSKKRKLHKILEENEIVLECIESGKSDEETLYSNFHKHANENCLHSSFVDDDPKAKNYNTEEMPSRLDSACAIPNSKATCAKTRVVFVSNKPSVSSKGFENSFKILQQQIENKSQLLSNYMSHPIFLSLAKKEPREDDPSRLELELEAMQRLQSVVHKLESGQKHNVPTSLLALFHAFVLKNSSKQDLTDDSSHSCVSDQQLKLINSGFSSDLMYYIGRDPDGRKCLKTKKILNQEGLLHHISHSSIYIMLRKHFLL